MKLNAIALTVPKLHVVLTAVISASLLGGGLEVMSCLQNMEQAADGIAEVLASPSPTWRAWEAKHRPPVPAGDKSDAPSEPGVFGAGTNHMSGIE